MSGGVTAASSVKLRLLRRAGAELGTSPSEWLRRPTPSPQSSRGQRKAITSLVFVAAQRVGWEGGHRGPGRLLAGSAISARGGLAGSSGRKVTVRLKSAEGRVALQSAEGLAQMGGEWCAPHCQGPWERLSPQGWPVRAGAGPRASAWEEGRDALLQGSSGLTLPLQGSHPYFCFHPDRVALQRRGHPMLFQNLP